LSSQLVWVLLLLMCAVYCFFTNKLRMDVVALLVIIAFVMSGMLSVSEALAGFSDANVILIAALFVVGHGLVRTGVAYQVGDWLVKVAGHNEVRLLVLLMVSVAGLGSVMSSTGVVAIFIPVVLSVAARLKISPAGLLMPLSFAGLISGMMTLVATPPNLVVNSELLRTGLQGFGFFSVTPIGVVVLLLGVGYLLLTRRRLLSHTRESNDDSWQRTTFRDLIRYYHLSGRAKRLAIRPSSPLVGLSLNDAHLRSRYGANVVGVERWRRFRRVMISANSNTELRAHDVLLLDMSEAEIPLRKFCHDEQLEPRVLRGEYFSEQAREVGMAEVSLLPDSQLIGKSLRDIRFRTRYGLNVVGMRRQGMPLEGGLADEPLALGDVLLVIGEWKLIRKLQQQLHNFAVLSLPAEVDEVAPAVSQAPHALFSLAMMVALMITNEVPNVIAALIACLMMGRFRCITMESAYQSIHWPSLLVIIGMMPFALALQRTGGVDLVVKGLLLISGDHGARAVLISLFILCAVTGLFISNTATAVLMSPIAIEAAKQMAVSPYPFAMMVMIGASAAFMTPVSSPVNMLVMVPGNFRFADFVCLGVPFTLLVMLVSWLLVPWLYPF
jgi:di/tricarboxylate transporter